MQVLGTNDISLIFGANTSQAEEAIKGLRVNTFGLGLILTGVGVAGVAAFQSIIDETMAYETAITNTAAVTGRTGQAFLAARDKIGEMSKVLGEETIFSAVQAAGALEDLARKGFDPVNLSLEELKPLLDLAAATQSDLVTSTEIVTATLRTFSLEFTESGRVADIFTAAITQSNLTIDKIATALPFVGTVAAQAGLSLEEMTATLGELSNRGIPATIAATGLRRAIAEILSPSVKTQKVLAELGLTTEALSIEAYGFTGVMENLRRANLTTGDALELFGQRAGPIVAALTDLGANGLSAGVNIDLFTESLENSAGKAQQVADLQLNTLAAKFELLQSKTDSLKIAIGSNMTPVLGSLAEALAGVISKVTDFAQAFPLASTALLGFFGVAASLKFVIGPLITIMGLLGIKFPMITSAVSYLATAMKGLLTLLGISAFPITTALVAVAGALAFLELKFGLVSSAASGLMDMFTGVTAEAQKLKDAAVAAYEEESVAAEKAAALRTSFMKAVQDGDAQMAESILENLQTTQAKRIELMLTELEAQQELHQSKLANESAYSAEALAAMTAQGETMKAMHLWLQTELDEVQDAGWVKRQMAAEVFRQTEEAATKAWTEGLVSHTITAEEQKQRALDAARSLTIGNTQKFFSVLDNVEGEFHSRSLEALNQYLVDRSNISDQANLDLVTAENDLHAQISELSINRGQERITTYQEFLIQLQEVQQTEYDTEAERLQALDTLVRDHNLNQFQASSDYYMQSLQAEASFQTTKSQITTEANRSQLQSVQEELRAILDLEGTAADQRLAKFAESAQKEIEQSQLSNEVKASLIAELFRFKNETTEAELRATADKLIAEAQMNITDESELKRHIADIQKRLEEHLQFMQNNRTKTAEAITSAFETVSVSLENEQARIQQALQSQQDAYKNYVDYVTNQWQIMRNQAQLYWGEVSKIVEDESTKTQETLEKHKTQVGAINENIRNQYLALKGAAVELGGMNDEVWSPFVFENEEIMEYWSSLTQATRDRIIEYYADMADGVFSGTETIKDILDEAVGNSWYTDAMDRFASTTEQAKQNVLGSLSGMASGAQENMDALIISLGRPLPTPAPGGGGGTGLPFGGPTPPHKPDPRPRPVDPGPYFPFGDPNGAVDPFEAPGGGTVHPVKPKVPKPITPNPGPFFPFEDPNRPVKPFDSPGGGTVHPVIPPNYDPRGGGSKIEVNVVETNVTPSRIRRAVVQGMEEFQARSKVRY